MCDITSLNNSNIKYNEPNSLFWTGENCSGLQMSLPNGDYPKLTNVTRIGGNDIDGLWVPPNMEIDVFNDVNYGNLIGTYGPGLYSDLNKSGIAQNNTIESIKLRKTKTWNEHLTDCCTGKSINGASPEVCGTWWGKSQNATGVCDDVMEMYCDPNGPNKDNPKCSCYSVPDSPNDTIDIKLLKAQPKCWSSTCSTKGYLPSNMINSTCPNVKICKQEFSLPGGQNILENNQFIQDCSDTIIAPTVTTNGQTINNSNNPATNNPVTNNPTKYPPIKNNEAAESNNNLYYYIIILFIIMSVTVYYKYYNKNNLDDQNNLTEQY